MRTRLHLNSNKTEIVGQFPTNADDVIAICDTSNGAFTITLPNVDACQETQFTVFNMPEDGIGNTLRVAPMTGQMMNLNDTYHDLAAFESKTFISDMKNRWLH